jgi:uncharacterized membrane protein (DUF373 family)
MTGLTSYLTRRLTDVEKLERKARTERQMENKRHAFRKFFAETCDHWPIMSVYERFEQIVAIVLSLVISAVIALALVQLVIRIVPLLLSGAIDPLEHDVFQALFGMLMTLLIALEFKHSIVRVASAALEHHPSQDRGAHRADCVESQVRHSRFQCHRRKLQCGAGGATLVLGVVYWLLRERDDRLAKEAH